MVKIPGLDDLKKMGSDLLDSAKTVDLSGMVDKVKAGIKKNELDPGAGDALIKVLHEMGTTLIELNAANAAEAAAIKKMQSQFAELTKIAASYQPRSEGDKNETR